MADSEAFRRLYPAGYVSTKDFSSLLSHAGGGTGATGATGPSGGGGGGVSAFVANTAGDVGLDGTSFMFQFDTVELDPNSLWNGSSFTFSLGIGLWLVTASGVLTSDNTADTEVHFAGSGSFIPTRSGVWIPQAADQSAIGLTNVEFTISTHLYSASSCSIGLRASTTQTAAVMLKQYGGFGVTQLA